MTFDIRILRPGDESVLSRVAPDVFDDPVVEISAKEFLGDSRHHLAVALDQEVVVGFASGVHYIHPDKDRPEFWINEVGVAPTHQGRGVGKALMRVLLETARELGCREAWVLTEQENTAALRLYSSVGGLQSAQPAVMFTIRLDANAN